MTAIGSKNLEARYEFFKKKKPSQIKKERPVEIRIPPAYPLDKIIEYIDGLGNNEYLRIKEDIIPYKWRAKAGKNNQNEIFNHGPYCLMEVYKGKPTAVMGDYFSRMKEPYTKYAWKGNDGIERFFRIVDILIADRIYTDSELIDEPIKVEGSEKEYCCEVLSRDVEKRDKNREGRTHKFVFISIPTDEDALMTWKDLETSHSCEYKDFNYFVHYRPKSFDCHDIAALWMINDSKTVGMKFDIFPRVNEKGRDFFVKLNDAVINNSRNLTNLKQDILSQMKKIKDGPSSIFDF